MPSPKATPQQLGQALVRAYRGHNGMDDMSDHSRLGGLFFTTDRSYAEQMANRAVRRYGGQPRVDEYHLDIGNAHHGGLSPQAVKEAGYHSALYGKPLDRKEGSKNEIVMFDKNRIKPVT